MPLLGLVSGADVSLLGILVGITTASLAGIVHLSLRMGRVLQQQADMDRRVTSLEAHSAQHDAWHLAREVQR